ncbi:MAG: hypothetical protein HC800_04000 [Phormidesmis sp. RL_2_1]|nr:hypothetical protein [Phormidesmis sp. RL_2_1]
MNQNTANQNTANQKDVHKRFTKVFKQQLHAGKWPLVMVGPSVLLTLLVSCSSLPGSYEARLADH